MKINTNAGPPIIVGKRITIGAAILAVSEAMQYWLPEHAVPIGSLAIPVIFAAQIIVVRKFGVTQ